MYIPYSELELQIIETNESVVEYFYPTLDELIDEHGDCDYTIIPIDGMMVDISPIEDSERCWIDFHSIKEN